MNGYTVPHDKCVNVLQTMYTTLPHKVARYYCKMGKNVPIVAINVVSELSPQAMSLLKDLNCLANVPVSQTFAGEVIDAYLVYQNNNQGDPEAFNVQVENLTERVNTYKKERGLTTTDALSMVKFSKAIAREGSTATRGDNVDNKGKGKTASDATLRLVRERFIEFAKGAFESISHIYLEKMFDENINRVDTESLVEYCTDKITALYGRYPRQPRPKRSRDSSPGVGGSEPKKIRLTPGMEAIMTDSSGDEEEDEEGNKVEASDGKGKSKAKEEDSKRKTRKANAERFKQERDYSKFDTVMARLYKYNSLEVISLKFPAVSKAYIRALLLEHKHHYTPVYRILDAQWEAYEKGEKDRKLKVIHAPRTNPLPKMSLDPEFVKEKKALDLEMRAVFKARAHERAEEQNFLDAQARGELVTCGCCFDEVAPNRVTQCKETHKFCLPCAQKACEIEIGYNRMVLKCMAPDCKSSFSEGEAKRFLHKSTFEAFLTRLQAAEVKEALKDSLIECPFCPFAVTIEGAEIAELKCLNPQCGKLSCVSCKKISHPTISCEENRKLSVLNYQHAIEEAMTEALIRECPQCKNRFIKDEGCNKMTCPCGVYMCYICKEVVTNGYQHFENLAEGQVSTTGMCRLWEDTAARNNNEVRIAGERALEAARDRRPDLAAAVQVDIPQAMAARPINMQALNQRAVNIAQGLGVEQEAVYPGLPRREVDLQNLQQAARARRHQEAVDRRRRRIEFRAQLRQMARKPKYSATQLAKLKKELFQLKQREHRSQQMLSSNQQRGRKEPGPGQKARKAKRLQRMSVIKAMFEDHERDKKKRAGRPNNKKLKKQEKAARLAAILGR